MSTLERRVAVIGFALGLLLAGLASPAFGQTVDVVSPPWRLYTADTDSTISFHNEIENAIERASLFPGRELLMMPSAPWRVTFSAPPPAPPADTVWIPADTVFVRPDTLVVVLRLPGGEG